jgi:hypothetical protein
MRAGGYLMDSQEVTNEFKTAELSAYPTEDFSILGRDSEEQKSINLLKLFGACPDFPDTLELFI